MKDHKEVSSDATGYFSVYDVRQSRLFIDGNLIQGFVPDRPMFGIKDNKLLVSLPVLKSPNWQKVLGGHRFDIVSPTSDTTEARFSGNYDNQTIDIDGDILFDGTIPELTLLFQVDGHVENYFEPIQNNFQHAKGGVVDNGKQFWI
jgi:hypothetical protein